jgi:hypothetical protein
MYNERENAMNRALQLKSAGEQLFRLIDLEDTGMNGQEMDYYHLRVKQSISQATKALRELKAHVKEYGLDGRL